jgi:hypothetical protein
MAGVQTMDIALWAIAIFAIFFLALRLGTAWLFRDPKPGI